MDTPGAHPGSLGHRIVVVGPSCSGKSTLASQLAALSGASFIELDALFWKPNWQESDPEEFRMRLVEAHAADALGRATELLRNEVELFSAALEGRQAFVRDMLQMMDVHEFLLTGRRCRRYGSSLRSARVRPHGHKGILHYRY